MGVLDKVTDTLSSLLPSRRHRHEDVEAACITGYGGEGRALSRAFKGIWEAKGLQAAWTR